MIISIGCDHAAYQIKNEVIKFLKSQMIEVVDYGTNDSNSVDYADFALKVAKDVQAGKSEYGILLCYTGIGMSIAANKINGIRASLVTSVENAILTRQHNNSNILCLSAKDIKSDLALKIVDAYLKSSFEGGRHLKRIEKIAEMEKDNER